VPASTSRSSTRPEAGQRLAPPPGGFAWALSVDLEEWYHTCWVEEWVDPARRPRLPEELDALLPETLSFLGECGVRATFFVLGEVARRLPHRIRELALAGHEVASHGELHFRAERMTPEAFGAAVARARAELEDLAGVPVRGFRAPEWSLRHPGNPRLAALAECGFRYDSSLSPAWGAGRLDNPRFPTLLSWEGRPPLLELPPLCFAGRLRLPAGGWTGRLAPAGWLLGAAEELQRVGGLPILTVHPWELLDRPCPGELAGLARLFHDAGRRGYRERLRALLGGHSWHTLSEALEVAERPSPAAPGEGGEG
jgi:peptidoglycan/xylan/chitin deacetylase (PgdA/CDA1 family)